MTQSPTPPDLESIRRSDRVAITEARQAYDRALIAVTVARAEFQSVLAIAAANNLLSPGERDRLSGLSSEQRRRYEIAGADPLPQAVGTPTTPPQEPTP